ncbi:YitT family protein [Oceanivirga miroungae]|uniref:DUF2179 domain-containing protein n=1 Tax=Oceanivirga miroungae TaxID=1130046 RepID=A0A6I8M5N0_9FUSO|nr:YitT family protein [Oceanivirga miroungae]VWL85239.1 hypothetical protein OMES3154_00522 [Oceanivirga miroungae]
MKKRMTIDIILIFASALLQSYLIEIVVKHANLVPMGFTGLSVLIQTIFAKFNIHVSLSLLLVLLNAPVAIFCAKHISKKFTFLSILQILLVAFFLKIFKFTPISNNVFLEVVIGSFIYGFSSVFALKGEGSTGGTDFIALYVSEKTGKTIWGHIFIFNAIIILLFGYNVGWEAAGYSIIFQYIITITISKFYLRYARLTLQIITKKGDEVSKAYINAVVHGMTKTNAKGCYTQTDIDVLYTVISTYELKTIVSLIKQVDPNAIINVIKTEEFYGNFILPTM